MGPYPVFACAHWPGLADDLDMLTGELVSVTLITDPFGAWTVEALDAAFPDLRVPYKEHSVVELARPSREPGAAITTSDSRRAACARSRSSALRSRRASSTTGGALYGELVRRHSITGVAAFSRAAFARQLQVPGIVGVPAHARGRKSSARRCGTSTRTSPTGI